MLQISIELTTILNLMMTFTQLCLKFELNHHGTYIITTCSYFTFEYELGTSKNCVQSQNAYFICQ